MGEVHSLKGISFSSSELRSIPHQLPSSPVDFVGRGDELRDLLEKIRDGGVNICGLRGMGGIGKSTLAIVLSEQLSSNYPDGQIYVDLKGSSAKPLSQESAIAHIIHSFSLKRVLPADLEELTAAYRSVLYGKKALLLLDNAASIHQIRSLIPPKECGLIVTSRERFALPGLYPIELKTLSQPDSRTLLMDISYPQVLSADTADRICSLCGFLPLAIRAAGSFLSVTPDITPEDYSKQLTDERTRLKRIGTEGVDVGIEASFNISYKSLSTQAKRVFRQLSIFPSSFDAMAEEEICDDIDHKHLSDLVRRNLVIYDENLRRYHLHDLMRIFATSLLIKTAKLVKTDSVTVNKRHSKYYASILLKANSLYTKSKDTLINGLELFITEWPNISAGQSWASANYSKDKEAEQLCSYYPEVGVDLLHLRLHPREYIGWLKPALKCARSLHNKAAEKAHTGNIGNAYSYLGETREAIKYYEEHRRKANEQFDSYGEASALANLALAYRDLGEICKAIELNKQALSIFERINAIDRIGSTLCNLGQAYEDLNDTCQAIRCLKRARIATRKGNDKLGERIVYGNLGWINVNNGKTRRAFKYFNKELELSKEIGDIRGVASAIWSIGKMLFRMGDRLKAIELGVTALSIYEQIGDITAKETREQLSEWLCQD